MKVSKEENTGILRDTTHTHTTIPSPAGMPSVPPMPPQTQQPLEPVAAIPMEINNEERRHERFYETGESLQDPVVLKVRHATALAGS